MNSHKLYEKSGLYDFCLKSCAFEGSLDRFLNDLRLDGCYGKQILDAGCGTGLLGLHFLRRFPGSKLFATDLEANFLSATIDNAKKRGICLDRIATGIADISAPKDVTSREGEEQILKDGSFDLICVGAVVGYSSNTAQTLRSLVELLSPNGYLVNLEMNEGLVGRFVSHRYRYHNISLAILKQTLADAGCEVSTKELSLRHIPAKLTRTAIIAHKSG